MTVNAKQMDSVIQTARLHLKLIKSYEDGSQDLKDVHKIKCDPDANAWSIIGTSKTIDDSRKEIKGSMLPVDNEGRDPKRYRASYIVQLLNPDDVMSPLSSTKHEELTAIGIVRIKEPAEYGISFAEQHSAPAVRYPVLEMELGYMFLSQTWGKGYAVEAVVAVVHACQRAKNWWSPYQGLWLRACLGPANTRSRRVLEKAGSKDLGLRQWNGESVFLGGSWQKTEVQVFSKYVIEPLNEQRLERDLGREP